MALQPSPSEALLSNLGTTGRLAVVVDLLLGAIGGAQNANVNNTHYTSAASANQDATNINAAPCVLSGFDMGNTAAYWVYVKFYNKQNPTSADTPIRRVALPPGGGVARSDVDQPFSASMSIRMTKGAADNDTTVTVAGDVQISLDVITT